MRLASALACFAVGFAPSAAAQQTSPQPRPGTVWVDDDFGPGTSGWGRTHFAAIDEGVRHVEVGGSVQVAEGTYPEALVLRKRVRLEGAGPLGTELRAVSGEDMLTIWAPGTSVRGFRFQNDGVPRAAVVVQAADRCTLAGNVLAGGELDIRVWPIAQDLTDLVVTDNRGIGTLLVGVPGYYPVRRCRIERNQARSIQVRYAIDLLVAENEIDTRSSGVYFPALRVYQSAGCVLAGNAVRSGDVGIEIEHCPGGLVSGNRVSGPFYHGINVRSGSTDAVVRENAISEGTGTGLRVAYVDRVHVIGNRVDLPDGATGLSLQDSESDRLEDNAFTGGGIVVRGEPPLAWDSHLMTGNTYAARPIVYEAGTSGFVASADAAQVILARCSDFAIEGLTFPFGAPGVQLGACDAGTVRACTFFGSAPSAVYANGCSELVLDSNAMLDAPGMPEQGPSTIHMEHCSRCTLGGNTLAFSVLGPGTGMVLLDCDGFEIRANTITNYSVALLYRYGPGGSRIHGNSFCSYNSVHDDCANAWDDGLGSGNYWDDYAGVDADGDGIGDTPHPISYQSEDAYPLMAPPGGALLWSDRHRISVADGGSTRLVLEAGRARAGQRYLVLGSASGTSPGTSFGGQPLPLNRDAYFLDTLRHPSSNGRVAFAGVLDAGGRAVAGLALAPGANPALAGTVLHHAACVVVLDASGPGPVRTLRVVAGTNAVPLHLIE